MATEPQDKSGVSEQLAAVRDALRQQDVPPATRLKMEQALDKLEREFSVAEPADPSALVTLLQAWEAKLEAEHPVLAGVMSDALQKLSAMGI